MAISFTRGLVVYTSDQVRFRAVHTFLCLCLILAMQFSVSVVVPSYVHIHVTLPPLELHTPHTHTHTHTHTVQVKYWLTQLAEEVAERLSVDQRENNRRASLMSVHYHPMEKKSGLSRCFPLESTDCAFIVRRAWATINKGQGRTDSEEDQLSW